MTVRDQLNRLPSPYNQLAIANIMPKVLDIEVPSVCVALHTFSWHSSPQKSQFWLQVETWAEANLDNYPPSLPPIP